MKRSRKFRIGYLIVLGCIVIYFIFSTLYSNMQLQKNFILKEHSHSYEDAINDKNIEVILKEVGFPMATALVKYELVETIEAPISIAYYQNINDEEPFFTIQKGNIITIGQEQLQCGEIEDFRGILTLPTTEKGWRLAIPFETEAGNKCDSPLYVKLTDIRAIAKEWVSVNPGIQKRLTNLWRRYTLDKGKYADYIVHWPDRLLYDDGYYLSQDLNKP